VSESSESEELLSSCPPFKFTGIMEGNGDGAAQVGMGGGEIKDTGGGTADEFCSAVGLPWNMLIIIIFIIIDCCC